MFPRDRWDDRTTAADLITPKQRLIANLLSNRHATGASTPRTRVLEAYDNEKITSTEQSRYHSGTLVPAVLRATSHSYGNGQNSTPHKI